MLKTGVALRHSADKSTVLDLSADLLCAFTVSECSWAAISLQLLLRSRVTRKLLDEVDSALAQFATRAGHGYKKCLLEVSRADGVYSRTSRPLGALQQRPGGEPAVLSGRVVCRSGFGVP